MKRSWKKSVFSKSTADLNISNDLNAEKVEIDESKKTEQSLKNSTSSVTTTSVGKNYAKSKSIGICPNWMEMFAPKQTEDLALHAKKLLEIKQWFLDCIDNSSAAIPKSGRKAKICLLTGPTGAGKTAAVRVLADTYQFEVMEWINPLDQNIIYSLGDQTYGETYVSSHLTAFKSYLHCASRYRKLGVHKRRLLLVEDFPNALVNDASGFEELLMNYASFGSSPLIFIVSDSKSRGLNLSYNLFPEEVKKKLCITHISFNPVANTIMQKAMKRFSTLMQQTEKDVADYKTPTQNLIDSIILSAQGDIRNALINFHFAALKGAPEVLTSEENSTMNSTKKLRSKKQTSLTAVGRDETCTMLHALGRVFNPKFTPVQKLTHSPELLALDFSAEPKKFLDFMHVNYLAHFSELEDVILAADCLSIADKFLQEYRNNALSTIGLNIATRGLMIANRKAVNGWMPVRGPKRYRFAESLKPSKLLISNLSKNLQAIDYQSFLQIIETNQEKESIHIVTTK